MIFNIYYRIVVIMFMFTILKIVIMTFVSTKYPELQSPVSLSKSVYHPSVFSPPPPPPPPPPNVKPYPKWLPPINNNEEDYDGDSS